MRQSQRIDGVPHGLERDVIELGHRALSADNPGVFNHQPIDVESRNRQQPIGGRDFGNDGSRRHQNTACIHVGCQRNRTRSGEFHRGKFRKIGGLERNRLEFDIKVPWGEDIPGNGSQFNGTIKIDWTNADGHSKRDSVTISGSVNDGACSNEDELVLSHYPLHVPFRPGSKWQVGGMGSFYGEGYHKRRSYYATDWNLSAGADLGEAVYPVAPGRVVAVRSGCDNCIVDQNQNGQQDDNEPCEWNYWDDNGCAICYRTNARFDDSYNVFSFWPHGDFSAGLGNYVAVEQIWYDQRVRTSARGRCRAGRGGFCRY